MDVSDPVQSFAKVSYTVFEGGVSFDAVNVKAPMLRLNLASPGDGRASVVDS